MTVKSEFHLEEFVYSVCKLILRNIREDDD